MCDALAAAGSAAPPYVAIDLDPARVAAGVLGGGAPVVFGDGANAEVFKAAGVDAPRAIAVTYQSAARCLEATSRLREAYPAVPIYCRSRSDEEAAELLRGGATAVVSEAAETALRFGTLLGCGGAEAQARLRPAGGAAAPAEAAARPPAEAAGAARPAEWSALGEEMDIGLEEVERLFELFDSLSDETGALELVELRDLLMRSAETGPIDDEELEAWTADADLDGSGTIGFTEYVRIAAARCGTLGKEACALDYGDEPA